MDTLHTKTSTTIIQRINILAERSLKIDDYDLFYNYMKYINTYYHLTGYRFLLDKYSTEEDNYNNHRSSELIALSEFDTKLSLLFFNESRKVEQALRTRLANLCGENDNVTFLIDDKSNLSILNKNYCNVNNLGEKFIAENLYDQNISRCLYNDINKNRREPSIKHYLDNYGRVIPIWVVVNYISFGTLLKLIDCLTSLKLNELMN